MIELSLHISAENATEALAELRHFCTVVNPAAEEVKVPVQIVGEEAPVTGSTPKQTRRKKTTAENTTSAAPAPVEDPAATPAPSVDPAPVPVPPAAPAAPTAAPVAPVTAPAAPVAPAASAAPAAAPTAPAAPKTYTLDEIARAGSALVDQGKMNDIMALMGKYGVEAITQLKDADYPAFVEDLRAMGAAI